MNTPSITVTDESDALANSVEGTTLSGWFRDTPKMRALLEEARARLDRAVAVPCAWGWCTNDYDPVDRMIIGGVGPMECPCDNLSGWNAKRPEGRARPQAPVKARGRHGSRVQRSTARRDLPNYDIDDFAWLAPRTTNKD